MATRTLLRLSGVLICLSSMTLAAQELTGQSRQQAQRVLESIFLNKQLTAKVTFPGWKDGIDVKTDGSWDLKWVTRQIKDHGVGIEVGDKASVTDVKLKDKSIEIHLNGGGAGTLGDALLTSKAKRTLREASGGKVPGGSRINLRFDHVITQEELNDMNKLVAYFDPVVDTTSLQQGARQRDIPEQFKEAAAQKLVVLGMDKSTVFAVMGEPKNKAVDLNADPPVEKWQFELPNLKTLIVTFKDGRVVKVDEL